MKVRWPGLVLVTILVIGILLLKSRTRQNAPSPVNSTPTVLLVADLREANEKDDRCAEIIQAVRETSRRGVHVAELSPDSKSDLLHRYHVLTVPTVLLFDETGKEIGRFEGEDAATLKAIKMRLAALSGTGQ